MIDSPIPAKVPDEEIYRLRDLSSGDPCSVGVDSETLFEICVEIELHRYDARQRAEAAGVRVVKIGEAE